MPTLIVGEGIQKEDTYYLLGKYSNQEITAIEIAGKSAAHKFSP